MTDWFWVAEAADELSELADEAPGTGSEEDEVARKRALEVVAKIHGMLSGDD